MNNNVLDLENLSKENAQFLNQIVIQNRNQFNEFISSQYGVNDGNIDWILSKIASRHPIFSSLFQNCCYLVFILEIIKKEKIDEVLVYSKPLKVTLVNYFSSLNVKVIFVYKDNIKVNKSLLLVKKLWYLLKDIILSQTASFRTKKCAQYDFIEPITLIDTFIIDGSFRDGDYRDRYYPGLFDCLDDNEEKYFYYLPTFEGVKRKDFYEYFSLMRKSKYHFLIKEDFLKVKDYWYALFNVFRLLKLKFKGSKYHGIDIKPLLQHEIISSSFDRTVFISLLNYRFVKRLCEKGIKVRLYLDWFENQLIDRSLIYGFRKFSPSTHTLGYLGYIVSLEYNINIVPTNIEYSMGLLPDKIAVIGKELVEPMHEFCEKLNVVVAPAFRFSNIWNERKFYPSEGIFTVLVTLPIELKKAQEILTSIEFVTSKLLENKIKFLIKIHPTQENIYQDNLFKLKTKKNMEFIKGNVYDYIEKSNLLISNASSTCVEALAKGIPVIVLEDRTGFLRNPIPKAIDNKYWLISFDKHELLEGIVRFYSLSIPFNDFEIQMRNIKEGYFNKITKESVRELLNLKNN